MLSFYRLNLNLKLIEVCFAQLLFNHLLAQGLVLLLDIESA